VAANKNSVCGALYILLLSMVASAAAPFADPSAAREEPLQEAIAALAGEVLAVRNIQGPMRIEWRNESSLSAAESDALQSQFSTQLAGVRGLLSDDASARLLSVTLRDTATQLVVVARIPSSDGEQIRIVQASRASFTAQSVQQLVPSLQKELLWKQREPILDAVEHAAGETKLLLVLGRETLSAYAPSQTQMELRAVAHFAGSVRHARALAGRIHFPRPGDAHFLLELPGRACSGTLAEQIALECGSSKATKLLPSAATSTKLLAPCDYSAWILSSDDGDWSKPDRLFLHDARAAGADRSVALEAPGPVLSLAGAPDLASSIAVVLNLTTGEYEVYRYALACHN